MTAATRHAHHIALARAERAAGQAFGYLDEAAVATHASAHRFAATATGAAFAVVFAATLAWAL
ncbi:hypothetical protein M446_4351 [Methylobacterium sp. 4-46]|uniref:hypothetical protein n=1 Tax=unclassified Methylobacterium TaxID=2615210 RepID=UPI000165CBC2|nr:MULTISPECIES: hypothetical protein [Methylobacterium]ACA18694.1 hypothetical protein M446_4351 [Methylobacterium sp. 4-46]WFT77926.1 hypothetical protein QA634_21820 [Methylobacterium nodulans]